MRQPALLLAAITLTASVRAQSVPAAPSPAHGALTRAERIHAQTAIERVFYGHRIWPKENPTPKPPFEEMIAASLIEQKADEPLRMSAALKQYWNSLVSG